MLVAALAAAGVCAPAMANDVGVFVRAEAGNSDFDLDTGFGSAEADDSSASLRGGYYFTPNFAVEAFYTRYGEDDLDGLDSKFDGAGVGIVAKKNFGADSDGFYISGRAGVVQQRVELSAPGEGSVSDKDVAAYVGVGVGYDFIPEFGIGLNYDYVDATIDFDGSDIDVKTQSLTLGAEYRFLF